MISEYFKYDRSQLKTLSTFINSDSDLKFVNDYIVNILSNSNSNIKMDFYYNHIIICSTIAYELSLKKGINPKNVVLATLLHDFGKYNQNEKHEIFGSIYAREILKKINYKQRDVNKICMYIQNHTKGIMVTNDDESIIVSDSDCISYIYNFEYFKNYEYITSNRKIAKNKLLLKIRKINDIISEDSLKIISKRVKIIEEELEEMEIVKAEDYLEKKVIMKVDRQLGTRHPKHGFMYMLNYGFIPNTVSGDGEELDAYAVGVFEPKEEIEGNVIAVIHRTNDDDDKLIVAPNSVNYTDDQIRALTEFQERFFESIIIRK